MSEIKKLIERLCPEGVEYKKLGEICKTISAPRKLQKNEYQDEGLFPVIDQGQEFIVGYTDETEGLLPSSEYVLYGDHTRIVKYYWGSFMQGADGLKILKFNNLILTRYAYHAICHYNIPSVGYRRHWSLAKEIEIPVPPIEVQSKIVEILDNFTELEAELKAELEARRKQYEYYRNQLLTFDKVGGARFDVKWMKLGEAIVSLNTGLNPRKFFRLNTPDANNYYITIKEIKGGRIMPNEKTDRINDEALRLCNNRSNLEIGDVLFSGTGTIGETAIIEEYPTNWNIKEGVYTIKPNQDIINSRYLRNILRSEDTMKSIMNKVAGGTVKSIPMKELKNISIPIPPLSEQKRIVSILDRFEALTTDLQSGLPAEIEARRKQYEYYREKLLTFKRKTA